MTNHSRLSTAALGIALLALFTVTASAQIVTMRLNVPFEFKASGTAFPAGQYMFEISAAQPRIVLSNLESSKIAYLMPQVRHSGVEIRDSGFVKFHKVGENYVLREVVSLGGSQHYEWVPTKAEREAAKKAGFAVAVLRLQR